MAFALLAILVLAFPWLRWDELATPGALRECVAIALGLPLLVLALPRTIAANRTIPHNQPQALRRFAGPVALFLPFAFAGWVMLSSIWSANDIFTEMESTRFLMWAALATGTALVASRKEYGHQVALILMISGCVSAIGAVIAPFVMNNVPLGPMGRLMWPLDHPASLGGGLVFPVVFGLSIRLACRLRHSPPAESSSICERLGKPKTLYYLAFPCLLAIGLSGTRSSMVGVVGGVFATFILSTTWVIRRITITLLLGLALAISSIFWSYHVRVPHSVEKIYTTSAGTRIIFAKTALEMAAAKPLGGWGAGSFANIAPKFEDTDNYLHSQRGDFLLNAHVEPLQILAELGIIGLIIWLGLHLVPIYKAGQRKSDPLSIACTGGLCGMLIESCISMSMRYHELPWMYALVLGTSLGLLFRDNSNDEESPTIKSPQKTAKGIQIVLAILVGYFSLSYATANFTAESEQKNAFATFRAQPNEAITAAEKASDLTLRQLTYLNAQQTLAAAQENAGKFRDSIATREHLLTLLASNAINRKNLVSLLYRLGQGEKAFIICIEGLQLNPHDFYADEWLDNILKGTDLLTTREWLSRTKLGKEDRKYIEARCIYQAGNRKSAIRILARQDLDKISVGLGRITMGFWYAQDGKRQRATATLGSLTRKYPTDDRALAIAAEVLASSPKDADVRKSLKFADRAALLCRENPRVLLVITTLYIVTGDKSLRDKAEWLSHRAIERHPQSPELHRVYATALLRLGKKAKALSTVRKAMNRFPDNRGLRKLKDLLTKKTPNETKNKRK